MSTRRIDLLIRKVRNETGNTDYGPLAGISQTTMCEYINDGLSFLERGINQTHAKQFTAEVLISLVAGQEKYDLPADFLPSGGIISVEYAFGNPSSTNPCWKQLPEACELERSTGTLSEVPSSYMVVNKQIWLKNTPSVAKTDAIRVLYTKRLTRLDIRRGTVTAVTLNTGAKTITSLTIGSTLTPNEFTENEACTIVDADGNVKMAGIKLSGADLSVGVVPVRSDFVYTTGETISVGNYLVFGNKSSTHQIDLDESVESFLVSYAAWKVLREDSNTNSSEQITEFTAIRDSILASYIHPNQGLQLVPEV